ncbi:hypothetical protein DFH28DRAFT_457948 [Melampsora americana]|nr:hypothetical protein DFH28DRAFT_457948 [Melampsora americana]
MFTQDPSLPSQSQSQPPRRLEGFHVSTTISIPNHQTDSQILQQQQQHHHHHTTSFNHFNGFGSNFSSTPSGHVTDAELLDSLIAQTSSSFNFDDQLQNTSFSSSNPSNHDQLSNQPNSFQSSQQHQPQPHTPLRTLPRHLDQSHGSPSISNSPLSPNDLYSPNSTGYNSSAPTHQNDIFAEHHYGSFSSAPPEDAPRSGRATSMSGRAPAPRSRSARRPSGSFPTNHPNNGSRHSLLLRSSALSIPNGNSESETPLAISAPTYLSSLNLGSNRPSKTASPDPGGWSTPNQIETHQTSNSSMIGFQQTHQHHHSNGFSKFDSSGLNSSPADSVLSHQTQILGTHPIIKDEMNSLIGSPALLRSTSVEVHQDLNHLDSNLE